jgi:hypothetical protein
VRAHSDTSIGSETTGGKKERIPDVELENRRLGLR